MNATSKSWRWALLLTFAGMALLALFLFGVRQLPIETRRNDRAVSTHDIKKDSFENSSPTAAQGSSVQVSVREFREPIERRRPDVFGNGMSSDLPQAGDWSRLHEWQLRLQSDDPQERRLAVSRFSFLGSNEEIREYVHENLGRVAQTDSDPSVRIAALAGLSSCLHCLESALQIILRDSSPLVRQEAGMHFCDLTSNALECESPATKEKQIRSWLQALDRIIADETSDQVRSLLASHRQAFRDAGW